MSKEDKEKVLEELGIGKKEKLYRLLHKPSGLFYKVLKHGESNMANTGKIYTKINHVKAAYNPDKDKPFRAVIRKDSPTMKLMEGLGYKFEKRIGYYSQLVTEIPSSEWEIVEV